MAAAVGVHLEEEVELCRGDLDDAVEVATLEGAVEEVAVLAPEGGVHSLEGPVEVLSLVLELLSLILSC